MIRLHSIFCDDMVMQAEKPVRIFGCGEGQICAFAGKDIVSTTAQNGQFLLTFPKQPYGTVLNITVTDDNDTLTLHRVLFGDVYLFAGQSNMAFKLGMANRPAEPKANDQIRFFATETFHPIDRFSPRDGWVAMHPSVALDLSALACFTAGELYQNRKRPIGIITAYQGASVIESWLSEKALRAVDVHLPDSALFPDHYMKEYAAWNQESKLYTVNILPLMPYALKAVVWYQGESNCGEGESPYYDRFLRQLILSWREGFQNELLPFVVVQIADFDGRDFPAWHEIQRKQDAVCRLLPECQLAVSRDISETNDIHPPTKHLLAARIARLLS